MPGPTAFAPFSVNRKLHASEGAQEDYPGSEIRAARNQSLFRAVSEKIQKLKRRMPSCEVL